MSGEIKPLPSQEYLLRRLMYDAETEIVRANALDARRVSLITVYADEVLELRAEIAALEPDALKYRERLERDRAHSAKKRAGGVSSAAKRKAAANE